MNKTKVLVLKCPICDSTVTNPTALREHRIKTHKNVYAITDNGLTQKVPN